MPPGKEPSRGPARRVRSLLTIDQLRALDEALIFAYRQHKVLCRVHPVANHRISRPGIPSSFSESLTAVVLPALLESPVSVAFGGRACDLTAFTTDGKTLSVELKASGVSSFQELKDRDLAADALVWVDFGSRYVEGQGPISFHCLPQPHRYSRPRNKLPLKLFLAPASEIPGFVSHCFNALDDALDGARGHPLSQQVPLRLPFTHS
jgi:hypothetical protein